MREQRVANGGEVITDRAAHPHERDEAPAKAIFSEPGNGDAESRRRGGVVYKLR
jgi:hypothetical protein